MVMIKKCCFCMSLRQGTYMSALYAIIISVLSVAIYSVIINKADNLIKQAISEVQEEEGYDTKHNEEVADFASTFVKVVLWIALVIYLVWFLTAILVFPALKTDKRSLLMPFLIFTGVLTGICVFDILSSFTRLHDTFASTAKALQFVMEIAIVCVNFYVMICVSSFYKNNLREAHEVNVLPVTSTVISAPPMVNVPPPGYSYNYHPAPVVENKAPPYDY